MLPDWNEAAGLGVPSNLPIDGHSFRRVEVLTGTPRRRRWSAAEKAAIVAESQAPGAQTWLNRPIARCSDKVSAIFAKPAASEMLVKQFPSLVKTVPALRAWQATYSWPFNITWAGKGGWPLILIVRWPQSRSRMWLTKGIGCFRWMW